MRTKIRIIVLTCVTMAAFAGIVSADEIKYADANNILEIPAQEFTDEYIVEHEPDVLFSDTIDTEEASFTYYYTAPRNGRYWVGLTDMNSDAKVSILISDSLGNKVTDSVNKRIDFDEGETYTITVEHYKGFTSFTLFISPQQPPIELSEELYYVEDTITFSEQKNIYYFTPKVHGKYNFAVENTRSSVEFDLLAWDDGGVNIMDTSGSGTIEMDGGYKYQIQVRQKKGVGSYRLKLGLQKSLKDITGYTTIHDDISFNKQRNGYYFTAPATGSYCFTMKEDKSNVEHAMGLWDDEDNDLINYTGSGLYAEIDHAPEKVVELTKGIQYFIEIAEWGSLGGYNIEISYPQEAQSDLDDKSHELDQTFEVEEETISEDETEEYEYPDVKRANDRITELESELSELQEKYDLITAILSDSGIQFN